MGQFALSSLGSQTICGAPGESNLTTLRTGGMGVESLPFVMSKGSFRLKFPAMSTDPQVRSHFSAEDHPARHAPTPFRGMLPRRSKSTMTWLGVFVPAGVIGQLNCVLNYLTVGRWMKENNFVVHSRLRSYENVFDRISQDVSRKRVLYLEFGVFEGYSMRYWSMLLLNPESHLHGFDSFEGLPES